MPPSVVVDASVLVSAFLFPGSIPGLVVEEARRGSYAPPVSPILIEEVRRSLLNRRLRDRYRHAEEGVAAWCRRLAEIGAVVDEPLPAIPQVCRDPDDHHVIAAAVAAFASCIVTGDKDLLELGAHQAVRIVTARDFLENLRGSPV
jgi:uncharacterized protein